MADKLFVGAFKDGKLASMVVSKRDQPTIKHGHRRGPFVYVRAEDKDSAMKEAIKFK